MDFTGSLRTGGLATSALLLAFLLTGDGAQADQVAGSGHRTHDGFRNTNPHFAPPALLDRLAFILRRTWTATFQPRSIQLPIAGNDGRRLRANQSDPTVTWIGHSTLLIQLDGVNLLTDPQWSDRASPVGFAGPRRVMPPGLRFEDLPPIHLVLISHDHYDHLDVESVRHLNAVHHPRFVVPLGLKAWFADLGIAEAEELDWWTSVESRGLKLICLPAQHFSGRTLWDGNRRLWSSWAVLGRSKRLFFAGDTGYYDVFQEIGRRLGPFDLAAIPIGAYQPPSIMRMTHLTPEEGLRIFNDVHGRRLVAIHWGTFDLTDEPLDEPPQRLIAEAKRAALDPDRILLLKHGETRGW